MQSKCISVYVQCFVDPTYLNSAQQLHYLLCKNKPVITETAQREGTL